MSLDLYFSKRITVCPHCLRLVIPVGNGSSASEGTAGSDPDVRIVEDPPKDLGLVVVMLIVPLVANPNTGASSGT